jgi:hypothetical protein
MSDITKREFEVLAVDDNNYLTWLPTSISNSTT